MLIYAVDDEKSSLFYLEESLREAFPNDEIITFNSPRTLLNNFKEKPADIVFSDIEMPGLSGIELAKELNEINNKLNIIFVTSYGEYATEAFDVFASGYIMKPCQPEQILKVVSRLRYPIENGKKLFVKTFGNFDVLFDGKPVFFRSPKSKELLAYLVDREGSLVSRQEMAGILFDDDFSRSAQVRLTKFATRLTEDLTAAGVTNFFFSDNGYCVDMSVAECDMTEYLKGNTKYTYTGEYMEQYSFAEYRKSYFDEIL